MGIMDQAWDEQNRISSDHFKQKEEEELKALKAMVTTPFQKLIEQGLEPYGISYEYEYSSEEKEMYVILTSEHKQRRVKQGRLMEFFADLLLTLGLEAGLNEFCQYIEEVVNWIDKVDIK